MRLKCVTVAFGPADRLGMRRRKCRNAPSGAFSAAAGPQMRQTMHFLIAYDAQVAIAGVDGPPLCAIPVASSDVVSLRISMQGMRVVLEVTWLV